MHAPEDSMLRKAFVAHVEVMQRRMEGVRGAFRQIYSVRDQAK